MTVEDAQDGLQRERRHVTCSIIKGSESGSNYD